MIDTRWHTVRTIAWHPGMKTAISPLDLLSTILTPVQPQDPKALFPLQREIELNLDLRHKSRPTAPATHSNLDILLKPHTLFNFAYLTRLSLTRIFLL